MALEGQRPWESALNLRLGNDLLPVEGLRSRGEHQVDGKRFDVWVDIGGATVAVEAKLGFHHKQAAARAAAERLEDGLADAAVAVCYPDRLTDPSHLSRDTEVLAAPVGGEFAATPVSGLAAIIRRLGADTADIDLVAASFKASLKAAAGKLSDGQKAAMAAAADLPPGAAQPGLRVALLVASACLFHARLDGSVQDRAVTRPRLDARTDRSFSGEWPPRTIAECVHSPQVSAAQDLANSWGIWLAVDYRPVFETARAVLLAAASDDNLEGFAMRCGDAALAASRRLLRARHDLLGRVFHWILDEARHSGAFYTSAASAVLLAGLALPSGQQHDLSRYTVVDPSCGTGTLLMATAERLKDLNQSWGKETGRVLIEDVLRGYDVDIAAAHMAAVTLGLLAPEVAFRGINIHRFHLGLVDGVARTGSLDLFDQTSKNGCHEVRLPGWPASSQVDTGEETLTAEKHDLVIMNPPFTRDSLRMDHLGPAAEKAVKARERQIFKQTPARGSHSGGMFLLLADNLCDNDEGALALVYPTSSCGAPSARGVWQELLDKFHLETVVTSHDPDRIYFSENTSINESLFVLRRLNDENREMPTRFVNLAINPDRASSATQIVEQLERGDEGAWQITLWPRERMLADDWTPVRFYSSFLAQTAYDWFSAGEAGFGPLSDMAEVGPAGRRIRDAYTRASRSDALGRRALWHIDTNITRALVAQPDSYIHPKPVKRKLADSYWEQRGRLLMPTMFSTPTMLLGATRSDSPVVGSGWVPVRPKAHIADPQLWEKAMCVYLNSTIGLMAAWMSWNPKKLVYPNISLEGMRGLQVPIFADRQTKMLAEVFDKQSLTDQAPLRESDGPRRHLDEAIASIVDTVDVETLTQCRQELAREPAVTGQRAWT